MMVIYFVNNKTHKNYYNLFTIFENQKYYLYLIQIIKLNL